MGVMLSPLMPDRSCLAIITRSCIPSPSKSPDDIDWASELFTIEKEPTKLATTGGYESLTILFPWMPSPNGMKSARDTAKATKTSPATTFGLLLPSIKLPFYFQKAVPLRFIIEYS